MTLYFLRHARADPPGWRGPDEDRPLDEQGRKEAQRVGRFLRQLGVTPSLILTSPLARAVETARIVAEKLELDVLEDPRLAPGFGAAKLAAILEHYPAPDLLLVGHEPDFSEALRALTGGSIHVAKGALARVDVEGAPPRGELIWLVTPKLLARHRPR